MTNSTLGNFGFKHKAGILMPLSSLPSKYGIGSFGAEAYRFVDFLVAAGQKCWQVLPLNPTSYGDSPYQSPASIAGNPYYIDLEILFEKGLLTKEELRAAEHDSERVDYGFLFNTRYDVLRLAYSRFKADRAFNKFVTANSEWVEDYALFMALKTSNEYRAWYQWGDELRDYKKAKAHYSEYEAECGFWIWLQYEFFREWSALLKYAHSKGIVIIGDMPIYVAHDSMDVWRAPDQFMIDDEYCPIIVAGCPPDAFSDDGQLWGNPVYNWQRMEIDSYAWWRKRIGYAFKIYDILRIDHFRGFASFYAIPYGDENAKRGNWMKAPGERLFRAIREDYPNAKIIAEDLGYITDDVKELLAETAFPGMKVLQFAFSNDDNEYLPRLYDSENCVSYTGSHDSECTKSWYASLSKEEKKRFAKECPRKCGECATDALITLIMKSRANLAVIPMQDYLLLTNEAGRMNTPSIASGNWQWRLKKNYFRKPLVEKIYAFAKSGKRVK